MKYYRVDFLSAAADEGDEWVYKEFQHCEQCGLNYLNYFSEFLVPEDTVEIVQAEVWEPVKDFLLEVAGLILGKKTFVQKMKSEGLTGFDIKEAQITCVEDEETIFSEYQWVFVTGRCHIADVWDKIVSECSHCKSTKTEKIKSNVRKLALNQPLPKHDLCRSRDRRAGLIVSDNFVNFVQMNWQDYSDYIKFKELPVL